VSAACVTGDGPVIARALGSARIAPRRDATPETPYPWFSVTKLFTATAVLQLVETGRVLLDEAVSTYVPSFRIESPRVPTLRHLLSHTSGLANPVPMTWVHLAGERGPTLDELTERELGRHSNVRFQPGTRFAYSNLNYLVLGQVIEQVSGESYESYVTEHVLGPLGATRAGFGVPADMASGYSRSLSFMGMAARFVLDRKFFGPTVDGFTELRPFEVDGAPYGGLVGTASEMLLLGRAMLAGGTLDGRTILRPETVQMALTTTTSADGSPLPIGLGWHLGNGGDEPYAFHLGGGGGFRSELRIYPRRKFAVAVIGNETSFDTAPIARLGARPRASWRPPRGVAAHPGRA